MNNTINVMLKLHGAPFLWKDSILQTSHLGVVNGTICNRYLQDICICCTTASVNKQSWQRFAFLSRF